MWHHYIIHMRPKIFFLLYIFALTGYASGQHHQSVYQILLDLLLLFIGYSVLAFGGTCALNSGFDRDEGPLNMLPNPPPVPRYLHLWGLFCMVLAVGVFSIYGQQAALLALGILLLSVFYSVPLPYLKWRGKEVGGIDNLINALGCGLFSVLLGYSLTGSSFDSRILTIAMIFTFTSFGSYPASQIFQLSAGKSYQENRNYVSLVGPSRSLKLCAVILIIGMTLLALVIVMPDWLRFSLVARIFYGLFLLFDLAAAAYVWGWSYQPFNQPQLRHYRLGTVLSAARYCWVVAEWVRL